MSEEAVELFDLRIYMDASMWFRSSFISRVLAWCRTRREQTPEEAAVRDFCMEVDSVAWDALDEVPMAWVEVAGR